MLSRRILSLLVFSLLATAILLGTARAVPPSEEAVRKWKAEGVLEEKLRIHDEFHIREQLHWDNWSREAIDRFAERSSSDANAIDTVRLVVILVDFPDYPYTAGAVAGTPAMFDSVLFSDRNVGPIVNPTGSMTDYYWEASYGKFYVTGDVYGWYTMPNTLTYYVGDDHGSAKGSELALNAAQAADPDVNFQLYRTSFSTINGMIVVHAGPGAETGTNNIWSHKGTMPEGSVFDLTVIADYNMDPEEFPGGGLSPIGVFCHEYGHTLGLPDWYDVSYTPGSEGLGNWAVMAAGSYNGNSKQPAHFCGYSKILLHWTQEIEVTENLKQVEIPPLSTDTVVYAITNDVDSREIWLVENRQPYGSDAALPGHGLCIYHVDLDASGNTNPAAYRIAVEQADGLNSMNFGGSRGDAGDPFPGTTNNRNFHGFSSPSSFTNNGLQTEVGVWEISDSDSLMYADLDVTFSRPWVQMYSYDSLVFSDVNGGDGDGNLEAGETIEFDLHIKNLMRNCYEADVTLSCNVPEVVFTTPTQPLGNYLNELFAPRLDSSIVFSIPVDLPVQMAEFTISMDIDSAFGEDPSTFHWEYTFDQLLGSPEILIVDDDNGGTSDLPYREELNALGMGYTVWNRDAEGAPDSLYLMDFPVVLWVTGTHTGTFTTDDLNALKGYLNHAGNFGLSTIGGINGLDSTFMADYLHATAGGGNAITTEIQGVSGSDLSDGASYIQVASASTLLKTINPAGLGETCFTSNGTANVGVEYVGAYRTVVVSFGFENIYVSLLPPYETRHQLFTRLMQFFGRTPTDVDDPSADQILPGDFSLSQNYPNPFNPSTEISYSILVDDKGIGVKKTELAVFNGLGQRVKTLVSTMQGPGDYTVRWDGTNEVGGEVATGVYFYRLLRGNEAKSRKMVLLK